MQGKDIVGRRRILFGALVLGLFSMGCGSAPAPRPPVASPVPRAPVPDVPIPEDLVLTPQGREAVQTLGKAEAFGGLHVGYAGTPAAPVGALRTLIAEANAAGALTVVLDHGSIAGQLMALSGLYFVDPARFAERVEAYRTMTTPVRVLQDGCIQGGDPFPASTLVEDTRAIRLDGPRDTLAAWRHRNPGATELHVDIVGGGYPALLRAPQPGVVLVTSERGTQTTFAR